MKDYAQFHDFREDARLAANACKVERYRMLGCGFEGLQQRCDAGRIQIGHFRQIDDKVLSCAAPEQLEQRRAEAR
jgi:hypothetical protein